MNLDRVSIIHEGVLVLSCGFGEGIEEDGGWAARATKIGSCH